MTAEERQKRRGRENEDDMQLQNGPSLNTQYVLCKVWSPMKVISIGRLGSSNILVCILDKQNHSYKKLTLKRYSSDLVFDFHKVG